MIDSFNDRKDDLLVAIERFQLVAKATHDVIWDWDLINNTVWWNEGMRENFGHAIEGLQEGIDSWYDRIHPDDHERVLSKIHEAIELHEPHWTDFYRFRRANGEYAQVHDRGYIIIAGGKPVRMVGSMLDLTQQLRLEKERAESEENLKFAMQAAQLGTWNYDPATGTIAANQRCRDLYGNPEEEILTYEIVSRYIHPGDLQKAKEAIAASLDPKIRALYDIRYRTIGAKDKSLRWLHCSGQAYFTENGTPYRFAGITRDITDEVLNREKVEWADQQAAMTIEGSGAGSFLVNIETDEVIYSPSMARILTGHEDRHVTRHVFIEHVHPEDRQIRENAYSTADETGELRYEARFIWDNGSVHWIRVIGQYLFDSSGKATSLSGIVMDISDRIDSEQRIRTSEEHLRTLIQQAPVATALFIGRDFVIDIPNAAMLKLWGKGDSVIGKPLLEALPELTDQPFIKVLNRIYETGEAHSEQSARGDIVVNGRLQTFYYDYTYKPLRNARGEIYAILDMAVDVTEQVKSRQALEKSEERYRQLANELERRVQQRTAELNQTNAELINSNNNLQQFAYAASHDMQEPLRKIQSFGSRLQSLYSKELDENGVFMLNRIQDASKRMSMMIDDLLAYSRLTTRDTEFQPVDMKEIVSNVLTDLEIAIQEQRTRIVTDDLPVIFGNRSQLTQLMQNLLSNAIKYRKTDEPSEIRLSSRAATADELVYITKPLDGHKYARIEVSDNGIGFDEIYLDRIFQMFQRLHGRSEFSGSGIGLALCKKVVQNHHGHITARSAVGEGSAFIVFLPVVDVK
ncbi:PAS domain-containing sensor histidine kinase [Dyadobacter aurulentus]|uniref:PAS domain-containing sensor histidine kinase n=1 Tax=Dyadobacter sp. UC 10 TaxID=2605428 RepID=UPI0011F0C6E4|nr:PAS domain-containing protein [Dyadobacter sp. UC 10]KAA0993671.1 PAS domain-containing protein [Dyadobacter sp. UC 10]